jgi:hypothetical protein
MVVKGRRSEGLEEPVLKAGELWQLPTSNQSGLSGGF